MKVLIFLFIVFFLTGCTQQITKPIDSSKSTNFVPPHPLPYENLIKNIELSCSKYEQLYPYTQLVELKNRPAIDGLSYDFRLYQAFSSSDWVPLVHEKSCQLAIISNMDQGISYCIEQLPKTSYMHNDLYRQLAYAKYANIALKNSLKNETEFSEADNLIKEFIANDNNSFEPKKAMAYFFAATMLTEVSKLSNNPTFVKYTLNHSIDISNVGLTKATDKSEILFALNQAKRELSFRASHF